MLKTCAPLHRKVDIRLHGKGNSNFMAQGRSTQIIWMTKWIRTSRLSIKWGLAPSVDPRCWKHVHHCIAKQLLSRNVERFRGGRVFEARRLCVSLNAKLRVLKKKKRKHHCIAGGARPLAGEGGGCREVCCRWQDCPNFG